MSNSNKTIIEPKHDAKFEVTNRPETPLVVQVVNQPEVQPAPSAVFKVQGLGNNGSMEIITKTKKRKFSHASLVRKKYENSVWQEWKTSPLGKGEEGWNIVGFFICGGYITLESSLENKLNAAINILLDIGGEAVNISYPHLKDALTREVAEVNSSASNNTDEKTLGVDLVDDIPVENIVEVSMNIYSSETIMLDQFSKFDASVHVAWILEEE